MLLKAIHLRTLYLHVIKKKSHVMSNIIATYTTVVDSCRLAYHKRQIETGLVHDRY